MTTAYLVSGMTCDGCVRAVTNAIQRAAPRAVVEVDLSSRRLAVDGDVEEPAIAQAVEDAGFGFVSTALA